MLKGRYLKYDSSITFEVFQKIWQVLYDVGWKYELHGVNTTQYCFDEFKKKEYLMYSSSYHPNCFDAFSKHCIGTGDKIITKEEILAYVKKEENIPEKWAIEVTRINVNIIGEYYNKQTGSTHTYTDGIIGSTLRSHNIDNVPIWKEDKNKNCSYIASSNINFPLITTEQFEKYILKKGIIMDNKLLNKNELIEGKWYKNIGLDEDYRAKFTGLEGISFCTTSYIHKNVYKECRYKQPLTCHFKNAVECTLEEIQKFLPEGHPDKVFINKPPLPPGTNKSIEYVKVIDNRFTYTIPKSSEEKYGLTKTTEAIPDDNKIYKVLNYVEVHPKQWGYVIEDSLGYQHLIGAMGVKAATFVEYHEQTTLKKISKLDNSYENVLDIEIGDTVKCIEHNHSEVGFAVSGNKTAGNGFSPNLIFEVTVVSEFEEGKCYFGGKNGNGVYSDAVTLVSRKDSKVKKVSEYKCNPFPTDSTYTILKVIKDIKRDELKTGKYLPEIIPAGSITWIRYPLTTYSGTIHIEDNKYAANIPTEYFVEVESLSKELLNYDVEVHPGITIIDPVMTTKEPQRDNYYNEVGQLSVTELHNSGNAEKWLLSNLDVDNIEDIIALYEDDDCGCTEDEISSMFISNKSKESSCIGLACHNCIFSISGNSNRILKELLYPKRDSLLKLTPTVKIPITVNVEELIYVPRI